MAIETDSYIQIDIDGVNYGKVGLSKTLDNYTIDEIAENAYCGEYNELMPLYSFGQPETPLTTGSAGWPYPLQITRSNQAAGAQTNYNYLYGRVVWLEGTGSTVLTESSFSSIKMVTEMQATKMVYTVPVLDGEFSNIKPASWNGEQAFPADYKASGIGSMTFHSNYGKPTDKTFSLSIHPYAIYVVDGVHFFVSLRQINECCTFYGAEQVSIYGSGNTFNTGGFGNITGETTLGATVSVSYLTANSTFTGDNELPFSYNLGQFGTSNKYGWDRNNKYVVNWQSGGNWGGLYAGVFVYHHFGNKMDSLKFFAGCGVVIEADKPYKPIIEGGIVTGISDDLTDPSELDEWDGSTAHDVPSGPPTPPKPSPGQWDNIEGAGTFNGTLQFVRSYYMSSTELLNLKTWMGKKEADGGPPDGYDMLDSIISIKMFPFALASGADDNVDITIPGSGSAWAKLNEICWITKVASAIDNTIVPENAPEQYRHINTGCKGHATNASGINYDLGSLNMNDFVNDQYPFFTYDAAVELYIPFIGTFTLDPQTVMGRTLHCYLNLDPSTGGVYGYCLCNNNGTNVMIASGTGNIGVDVPISSAQAGVLQAQVDAIRSQQFAALVSTAVALAMPALGAGLSAATAERGISGAAMAMGLTSPAEAALAVRSAGYNAALKSMGGQVSGELASVATNAIAANRQVKNLTQSHNMAMTGTIGASTAEWGCPWDAYVKVMRPKVHNPGNNYNHAVAVPTYKSGKLSSYKGLTVCINPDASKITKATPAERNAIVTMLQGGVIV